MNLFKIGFITMGVFSLITTQAVFAAKPSTGGNQSTNTTGIDISYPQCGKRLPGDQAFVIVGVNNGLANTSNPCFSDQLTWAKNNVNNVLTAQPKVALYVNTANPGHAATVWPSSNEYNGTLVDNPFGTCTGDEDAACAYMYGWVRASEDTTIRNVPTPASFKWWLDVETTNSWSSTDLRANAASLQGMTDLFHSLGAQVGVYSTNYQWSQIVGTLDATSTLNGLESWMAGALSLRGATQNCSNPGFTPTSKVTMAQYVSKGIDYNYSCQ
jgi:hypothetical protein